MGLARATALSNLVTPAAPPGFSLTGFTDTSSATATSRTVTETVTTPGSASFTYTETAWGECTSSISEAKNNAKAAAETALIAELQQEAQSHVPSGCAYTSASSGTITSSTIEHSACNLILLTRRYKAIAFNTDATVNWSCTTTTTRTVWDATATATRTATYARPGDVTWSATAVRSKTRTCFAPGGWYATANRSKTRTCHRPAFRRDGYYETRYRTVTNFENSASVYGIPSFPLNNELRATLTANIVETSVSQKVLKVLTPQYEDFDVSGNYPIESAVVIPELAQIVISLGKDLKWYGINGNLIRTVRPGSLSGIGNFAKWPAMTRFGSNLYIYGSAYGKMYALTLDGARDADKDISLSSNTNNPVGACADDDYIYVLGNYGRFWRLDPVAKTATELPKRNYTQSNAPKGLAHNGSTVYALVSNTRMDLLDPTSSTGTITSRTLTGVSSTQRCFFNDDSVLYGIDIQGNVFAIDPETGNRLESVEQAVTETLTASITDDVNQILNKLYFQAVTETLTANVTSDIRQEVSKALQQGVTETLIAPIESEIYQTIPTPYDPFIPVPPRDAAPGIPTNLRVERVNGSCDFIATWNDPLVVEGVPDAASYRMIVAERNGQVAPYIITNEFTITSQTDGRWEKRFASPTGVLGGAINVGVSAVSAGNVEGTIEPYTLVYGDCNPELVAPTWHIDWNNNGLFDHPLSDITKYVTSSKWSKEFNGNMVREWVKSMATVRWNMTEEHRALKYYNRTLQGRRLGVPFTTVRIRDNNTQSDKPWEDSVMQAEGVLSRQKQRIKTEQELGLTSKEAFETILAHMGIDKGFRYGPDKGFYSWQADGDSSAALNHLALNTHSPASRYNDYGVYENQYGIPCLSAGYPANPSPLDLVAEHTPTSDPIDSIVNRIVVQGIGSDRPQPDTSTPIAIYDFKKEPSGLTLTPGTFTTGVVESVDHVTEWGTSAGTYLAILHRNSTENTVLGEAEQGSVILVGNHKFAIQSVQGFWSTPSVLTKRPNGWIFFGRWLGSIPVEETNYSIYLWQYDDSKVIARGPGPSYSTTYDPPRAYSCLVYEYNGVRIYVPEEWQQPSGSVRYDWTLVRNKNNPEQINTGHYKRYKYTSVADPHLLQPGDSFEYYALEPLTGNVTPQALVNPGHAFPLYISLPIGANIVDDLEKTSGGYSVDTVDLRTHNIYNPSVSHILLTESAPVISGTCVDL